MSKGYIYCLSCAAMPGLVKVGMTGTLERTPELRAKELSAHTGVPTPFKVEFAKAVSEPKQKEEALHKLLSRYTERINPKREFFRTSPERVMEFFAPIDGEIWIKKSNKVDEDEDEEEEKKISHSTKSLAVKGRRDMSKYFINGQRIRHTIGINKTWIGKYDSSQNKIIYDKEIYNTLSHFVNEHHRENGTYRNHGVSGWICTDCEIDGQWVSTSNLPAF